MWIGILFIWAVTALGLAIVAFLLPGVRVKSLGSLLLAALILGLVNALIRPILWLLTLPLTVLTFGLFALVINALMIWFTAAVVKGFDVDGFGSALLAALLMALLGLLGFALLQWWMIGNVEWIYYEHQGNSYSI